MAITLKSAIKNKKSVHIAKPELRKINGKRGPLVSASIFVSTYTPLPSCGRVSMIIDAFDQAGNYLPEEQWGVIGDEPSYTPMMKSPTGSWVYGGRFPLSRLASEITERCESVLFSMELCRENVIEYKEEEPEMEALSGDEISPDVI